MHPLTFGVLASILYLGGSFFQFRALRQQLSHGRNKILAVGMLALLFHGLCIYGAGIPWSRPQFSFYFVPSLIFFVVLLIVLLSSLRKPLENLLIGLYPLASIAIFCSLAFPDATTHPMNSRVYLHAILSLMAYAIITIAVCQALLLAHQERQLRSHHSNGWTRNLPPLQTMEALLFEFIWAGFILLTLAMTTGFVFLEDLFAQHLVHKTVLSIASWFTFLVLLWGRHQIGWRGQQAIRWTLSGFLLLALAYFGSKLALELILNRV